MAGRQPCIAWCPAMSNNGERPSVAAISEPPAEIGEKRSGRLRETQRDASIRSRPRLTETGDRHNGGTEVPLTKGTPCEQCRRRPQGHNGCEEDDRSSYPRFRSAPTERQAPDGCENFLQNPPPLVPTSPASCRARSCPSIARSRSGRRAGHSAGCTKTAPSKPGPCRIRRRNAPHSRLVSENAAQVSNEVTVATVTSLQIACQGHQVAARQPVALDEALPPRRQRQRRPGRAPVPPGINGRNPRYGHGQPLRRRRRRVTLRAAAPAEEAPERLDAVTAVAFPACHGALTGGPALTTVGHWPT